MHFDPPTPRLACPRCLSVEVSPVVRSLTVATLACQGCGHEWAVDLNLMPDSLRGSFADPPREFHSSEWR
jgi:hypothetical protein